MRIRWAVFLLIGLAALALSGWPSAAEPASEGATGIWSTTECGKDGLTFLVNSRIALMIEGGGLATRVAVAPIEWVGASIMLTVKGEAHERLVSFDDLKQCDGLPGTTSLLLADVVTVFNGLDGIVDLCRGMDDITSQCAAAAGDLIDVTGDGVFSRAELRQAMRAASFFIAYREIAAEQREAWVSLESLYVAQLAASLLGPFIVGHLIDSYDSDGDEAVSPEELLRGRSPQVAAQDILANLVAKAPPGVASMLRKSIPDF